MVLGLIFLYLPLAIVATGIVLIVVANAPGARHPAMTTPPRGAPRVEARR